MGKVVEVSDEAYAFLLSKKHEIEEREGRVIGMREVVDRVLGMGGKTDGREEGDKRSVE